MKIIDAIFNVDRPKNSFDYSAPTERICARLNIEYNYDEDYVGLNSYPIYNWYCTDSYVGLNAIYLDDEPVGCSWRGSRRADLNIEWISEQAALKVREFLSTKAPKPTFEILNPDYDIGESFSVNYVGQSLTQEGFYQDRPVQALIWYNGYTGSSTPEKNRQPGRAYTISVPFSDPKCNCVLVQDANEQVLIPITEFKILFDVDYQKIEQTNTSVLKV